MQDPLLLLLGFAVPELHFIMESASAANFGPFPGSPIPEQRRQGQDRQTEHLREAEAAFLGEALGRSAAILSGKIVFGASQFSRA